MPNQQTYNDLWVLCVLEGKTAGYYVEAGAVDEPHGYVPVMNPYRPDSGPRCCTYYHINLQLVAAPRIVPTYAP